MRMLSMGGMMVKLPGHGLLRHGFAGDRFSTTCLRLADPTATADVRGQHGAPQLHQHRPLRYPTP